MHLSNRYTEAIQDVNNKLRIISENLERLSAREGFVNRPPQVQSAARGIYIQGMPPASKAHRQSIEEVEPFHGPSSFKAHATQLCRAVQKLYGVAIPTHFQYDAAVSPDAPLAQHSVGATFGHVKIPTDISDLDPNNGHPLPQDLVLTLLRLTRVEKQRFFIDVPIIDENAVHRACQKVYFAGLPVSPSTKTIANVSLYFLLWDLDPTHYRGIGLPIAKVQEHLQQLRCDLHGVCRSLQLCEPETFESAQARSLLGMFFLKQGQIEKSWQLFSSAARICLDLGLNRPIEHSPEQKPEHSALVLWLYAVNHFLALTLGRPPTLRRIDIGLDQPDLANGEHARFCRYV